MFFVLGFSFQLIFDHIEQIPTFIAENPIITGIIAFFTAVAGILFFFDEQLKVLSSIIDSIKQIKTQLGLSKEAKVPKENELQESRQKLLKAFSIKLEKRLGDILSDDQLIALSYEQRYEQIGRVRREKVTPEEISRQETHWQTRLKSLDPLKLFRRESEEPEELAPEEKLIDIFWREHGRLFILGAPGSGKTTTLLELARELVIAVKANEKSKIPIPIIFELSNWKDDQQSIEQFLVAQLKEEFLVPIDIGKYWVTTNQILPLFDGLDEVGTMHLPLCVEKLNEFLPEGKPDRLAVVCCRTKEFQLGKKKLYRLNGAVELQGLSDGQIQQYLQDVKQPSLWEQKIKLSQELTNLARTPLMLTVMAVALSNQSPTTRTELFEAYINERFERYKSDHPNVKVPYSSEQTCKYLQRLAWQLKSKNQTAFLIEGLQPKAWLKTNKQKVIYCLILGQTLGLILGLIFGLISGLISENLIMGLVFGVIFGLVVGLFFGLILGLIRRLDNIKTVEIIDFSLTRIIRGKFITNLIRTLISGLIGGICGGQISALILRLISGLLEIIMTSLATALSQWLLIALTLGLVYGTIFGLIFWLIRYIDKVHSMNNVELTYLKFINMQFARNFMRGLLIGLLAGKMTGMITGSIYGLTTGVIEGLKSNILTRTYPNQGILASTKNGILFTCLGGIMAIFFSIFLPMIFQEMLLNSHEIRGSVGSSMIFSILVPFFLSGGWASIQHFALRIILWSTGNLPLNYAAFLQYTSKLRLTRQTGGEFRFLHDLLQEHFAEGYANPESFSN